MLSFVVMTKKDVGPSFWMWFFMLFPIVNTYVVIRYFRINVKSGFKEFWEQLNNNV